MSGQVVVASSAKPVETDVAVEARLHDDMLVDCAGLHRWLPKRRLTTCTA